jgi:hypothetical protein
MGGKLGVGIVLVLGALGVGMPGCASPSDARYVYQDSQFGVVAIPRNTPQGREHYRQQAEALMAQHFPEGYEVVRAEEVVEGSRTLTVGKTGTTELAPQVSPQILAFLKVGGSMTRNQADTVSLTECRIIYKKAGPQSAASPGGFATDASLKPTCYLDPNTVARKPDKEKEKDADRDPAKLLQAHKDPEAHRAAEGPIPTCE